MKNKIILDAACGGRMFWFNKKHPRALYIDNRIVDKGHVKQRNCQHEVKKLEKRLRILLFLKGS